MGLAVKLRKAGGNKKSVKRGTISLIRDAKCHRLTPNCWSSFLNYRLYEREVMKTRFTSLKKSVARIHNDERGLEALQVVMIVAIAAIFLIFVKTQWTTIKGWAEGLINQVTSFTS